MTDVQRGAIGGIGIGLLLCANFVLLNGQDNQQPKFALTEVEALKLDKVRNDRNLLDSQQAQINLARQLWIERAKGFVTDVDVAHGNMKNVSFDYDKVDFIVLPPPPPSPPTPPVDTTKKK